MDPALWELLRTRSDRDADEVEAIIRLDRPHVAVEGVRIIARFGPIATCRLPIDSILRVRAEDNVESLKLARSLVPEDELESGLTLPLATVAGDERRPRGLPLTGAGVVIGIVDWGCDFDYPSFKHSDGSTRLIALWDQRGQPPRQAPSYYGYGTFYGRRQIDRALSHADPYRALGYHPADADKGGSGAHGTCVMDIAAGNGLAGGPVGVAPQARLIFVHLANRATSGLANLGDSVRILEAVDFIVRTAGRRPCVINLSLGNQGGPHDGCTATELAFDFMLRTVPNLCVVNSGGNYRGKRIHASGRLKAGQTRTLGLLVDKADVTPNELEVWYSGKDALAVRTESPTGVRSTWVRLGGHADIVDNGEVVGRIYNRASDPYNSDNVIEIFLYPAALPGPWSISLRADLITDGAFHAWLERDDACSGCQTRFRESDSDSSYTTGTLANSREPLVVGAYDGHSPTRDVAPFSSSGPTRDGRCKPDLGAPGMNVLSARSAPHGGRTNRSMLVRKGGTSFAAPHVAGAAALCLQGAGRPLWNHEIRDLLLSNAEPATAAAGCSLSLGSGYLNLAKVVDAVLARRLSAKASPASQRVAAREDRSAKEGKMKPDLSEHLDRLEQLVQEPAPRAASERRLLAEIARTNGAALDPDQLYRAIVSRRSGSLSEVIEESFTVLARPREAPTAPPEAGDVLLRVALGHPGLGHVAVLLDGTLWSAEQLASAPFRSESSQPGYYAAVLEAGAFPHTRFGRLILGREGRMPFGALLLRPTKRLGYLDDSTVLEQSTETDWDLPESGWPYEDESEDHLHAHQTGSANGLQQNFSYDEWDTEAEEPGFSAADSEQLYDHESVVSESDEGCEETSSEDGEFEAELENAEEARDLVRADAIDVAAAQPVFPQSVRERLGPLLDLKRTREAAKWNSATHPARSGIDTATLQTRLGHYLNITAIEQAMRGIMELRNLAGDRNAVLAIAAHQFQQKIYASTGRSDGKIGEGTLDALGFVRHRDASLNSTDEQNEKFHVDGKSKAFERLQQVYKTDKDAFRELGPDASPATWYRLFVNAPFLGRPFTRGIHVELMRRLRRAEQWLLGGPAYRGMTPVELGKALGIDEDHHGGRAKNNSSMHTLGLAVDIRYTKNPWVAGQGGAPTRNKNFQDVTRNVARLLAGAEETITPQWLSMLGADPGRTTASAYLEILNRQTQLQEYLSLEHKPDQLKSVIQARAAGPDGTGFLAPGESIDRAVERWRGIIRADRAKLQHAFGSHRQPEAGFMDLHRDLVVALRDHGCLAWGAIDLGRKQSGDMMHFDCRAAGIGWKLALATQRTAGGNHLGVAQAKTAEKAPAPESPTGPAPITRFRGGHLWTFTATTLPVRVAVFCPKAAASVRAVDVLVYAHGLVAPCPPVPKALPEDLITKQPFELGKLVDASNRAILLIVPFLDWGNLAAKELGFGPNNRQHALARPANLNGLVAEVLAGIGKLQKAPAPSLERLALAGHSRAYDVLDPLAGAHTDPQMSRGALARLAEVWAFDTTYTWPVEDWKKWLASKPGLTIDVFYRKESRTEKGGDEFAKAVKGSGGRLRVTDVSESHCLVPVRRLPALLARSGAAARSSPAGEELEDDRAGRNEGEWEDEREEAASQPSPVRARILWPALGFPAVIAPRDRPAESAMLDADATRCVCVLLLSNRKYLSKAEAAKYLRYAPWPERGRRHIRPAQPGSFAEEELSVRNDASEPRLVLPSAEKDRWGTTVAFGANRGGENGVIVNLAHCVRNFYQEQHLPYLHEIRISETASGRLQDGLYHLFWNNENPAEKAPSDEMALLLRQFARPRREKKLGELWEQLSTYLLDEYEYEYGGLHPPYQSTLAMRRTRAEVLHPLFVRRSRTGPLRIGHITDTHVDVRADVYEENLKQAYAENLKRKRVAASYDKWTDRWTPTSYNNWNRSFVKNYDGAKQGSDVILLTGDLIDYGRGHWGLKARDRLGDDSAYHEDRNWFLFYHLFAAGDAYKVPAYTILGNHDWRLNPYPPFAPGAPSPQLLINNYEDFSRQQQEEVLRSAHGPGHKRAFSYSTEAENPFQLLLRNTGDAGIALLRMAGGTRTMDRPHIPTETTVESVAWYLLAINPFLDYAFSLPSGHSVLMLDWAEDEDVLFPIVERGKERPYQLWEAEAAADPGPKARNCLTSQQKRLVSMFTELPGKAKIVGIHAPPIGPYTDWSDDDLLRGRKNYDGTAVPRGPTNYAVRKPDGSIENWNGHPLFALRPPDGALGMEADYNSLSNARDWFIRRMAEPKSGVRVILTGHIHRSGLYVVHVPGADRGKAVAGQMLVRGVVEQAVRGARPPAVALTPEGKRAPLYVNTTSAGPRGNYYPRKNESAKLDPGYAEVQLASDGTIHRVDFWPQPRPKKVKRPSRADVAKRQTSVPAGTPVMTLKDPGFAHRANPRGFPAIAASIGLADESELHEGAHQHAEPLLSLNRDMARSEWEIVEGLAETFEPAQESDGLDQFEATDGLDTEARYALDELEPDEFDPEGIGDPETPAANGVETWELAYDEGSADQDVVEEIVEAPLGSDEPPAEFIYLEESGLPEADRSSLEPGQSVVVDGQPVRTYVEAVAWYTLRRDVLVSQKRAFVKDGYLVPDGLDHLNLAANARIPAMRKLGSQPISDGGVEGMLGWRDVYLKVLSECDSKMETIAADRFRATRAALDKLKEQAARLQPQLREFQRSAFRKGDKGRLKEAAETFATRLDSALVAEQWVRDAVTKFDDIKVLGTTLRTQKALHGSSQPWHELMWATTNAKMAKLLSVANGLNKTLAVWQLFDASLAVISGGKTSGDRALAGISLASTAASAGGTLLGASGFFTLYTNLYIGKMVKSILGQIDQLKDRLSIGRNRPYMQLGRLDQVDWSIEPGGREMYEFMHGVMPAHSATDIKTIPAAVGKYFSKHQADFDAGTPRRHGVDIDYADFKDKRDWIIGFRDDIWGMLYGATPVP